MLCIPVPDILLAPLTSVLNSLSCEAGCHREILRLNAHFLAVAEHRLVPARARKRNYRFGAQGLAQPASCVSWVEEMKMAMTWLMVLLVVIGACSLWRHVTVSH